MCCYPCQKYLNAHYFTFDNWTKIERLSKHQVRIIKRPWRNGLIAEQIKKNTSILSKLQESHKQYVKENCDYLKAQRGHDEQRESLSNSSDVNRGNFLELIHLRCKDIAWLKDKLESLLQKHTQWTSPVIQNEQLQIIADLRKKHSLVSTPQNQPKVKYCMNW